ncbi:hypothetical protein GCM10009730_66640 [Streptomyces albidochromogenes]|uniref:dihydrofolate reductase family protein n=1 Tax=Streptomyces albidochromogenes TaxID=329524 RepID=UPI001FCA51FA|nr:dihydrofolate reductase [Streptomyces albidochromogenes]
MDWLTFQWTGAINAHIDALTDPVDCIVLGRKPAEGFIPTWAAGPEGEDRASIDKMNNTPKVVISRTLTESTWENAVVAGDLAATVNGLKARPDMIAYGGRHARRELDHPGAPGRTPPLRQPDRDRRRNARVRRPQRLRLVTARPFDCGITALHFEPKRV